MRLPPVQDGPVSHHSDTRVFYWKDCDFYFSLLLLHRFLGCDDHDSYFTNTQRHRIVSGTDCRARCCTCIADLAPVILCVLSRFTRSWPGQFTARGRGLRWAWTGWSTRACIQLLSRCTRFLCPLISQAPWASFWLLTRVVFICFLRDLSSFRNIRPA